MSFPYTAYVTDTIRDAMNAALMNYTPRRGDVQDICDILTRPPYATAETEIGTETVEGFFDGTHPCVPELEGFYSPEMLEEGNLQLSPPTLSDEDTVLDLNVLRHLRYRVLLAGLVGVDVDGEDGFRRDSVWRGKKKNFTFKYGYLATCLAVFAELSEGRAQTFGGHKEAKFIQIGWTRAWVDAGDEGEYFLNFECRQRGNKSEGS